eukprot:TRINITY_DN3161_c0_g1_i1.p1 TRINITY_DN3161_c0_g1~~TRINITY_DN3161_c0_g1_i1.p1  ORF type:complete len:2279 (+),score=377.70 TRINITY_DN3161_c0_g1_i1:49-6837(+)
MFRTAALTLLLVTHVSAQCSFDVLRLTLRSNTYIGQNIITGAVMMVDAASTTVANCAAGGTVATTETCVFTKAGYEASSAGSDVATCTGTTWSTPSFIGVSCTALMVANAMPTAINGRTEDVVTVACVAAHSCGGGTCDTTCGVGGTFAPAVTCVPDCAINTVTGASLAPGCTEGGTVADGGTCTWIQDNGYTCTAGLGLATCATGAALPGPTAGQCTENFCAAFALNSPTTGIIAGADAGSVLGCTDMVILGPISNPTCNLQCDTANGYVSGTGVLGCAVAATAGTASTTSLTCNIVTCSGAFDHVANGINDPMGGLSMCDDVKKTACTLTCNTDGFTANMAGAPTLTCTQMGDVGQWVLTNPCIGPSTCDIYTCPDGYNKGANPAATMCTAVDAVAMPQCTAMDMGNNMVCCPTAAPCPANSNGVGVCNCDTGFTGTPQWGATSWTHTCTEITCTAYAFTTGQVGGTTDACTDGIVLSAVVDTACNIDCAAGYVTATGQLQCSNTGILSGPGVTCVEKQCAAYTLPTGVVGGTSGTPCTTGIVLAPITSPSCGVQCAPGYSGTAATIVCGTGITNGAAPTGTITCTENQCAAYAFPTGVIGGMGTPCVNNGQLTSTTNPTCSLQCDTGYSGSAGTLTCASNANDGDSPTGGITCTATCTTHTCGVGYSPLTTPGAVTCTGGVCTDAQCCDVVPCPADAAGVGSCTCNVGWTGTPVWVAASLTWTHVCIPHCANTFFSGCAAGTALVATPAAVNCTGPAGCDMTTCPQCQQTECCDDLVCTAPGTSRPEYQFSGGNTCTTVTSCGTVTCSQGYTGTPSIICNNAGGMFSLTGCNLVACPTFASGDGVCNCDTGYGVVGGGGPVWDTTTRTWSHTCRATCDNPLFTACSGQAGLLRKPSPEAIFCTGTSGTASVDCTADICCDATCNSFTGCTAMGLNEKTNIGAIRCSTNLASSCDITTCCDASCDNTGFTTCSQPGYQLKLLPESLSCNGSSPANCDAATCCDATDCINFNCVPGSRRNPLATTCNGVCNHATCCIENTCNALTANDFPWYTIPGRAAGCNSETACGTITCASGFHDDPFPELKCLVEGGTFTASGCVENNCTGVGNLNGYTTAGGAACNTRTTCGTVSCAAGYNAGSNTPALICAVHNGAFQGTGCSENVCLSPQSTPLLGYSVATPTCTVASACGAVTCAAGFTGSSPIIACQSPGNAFNAAGCVPNTCQAPLNNFVGYDIQAPTCTTATTCGSITCATGYTGTPAITCFTSGGQFTFTGCAPASCPAGANGTNCPCNVGYTGTPNWNGTHWIHVCAAVPCPTNSQPVGSCVCNVGNSGTPVWDPTGGSNNLGAWTHTCTPAACPANADPATCNCLPGFSGTPNFDNTTGTWTHQCQITTCLAPGNSLSGYILAGGNTCTTIAGCGAVTCAQGFTTSGTPAVDCPVNGGSFTATGCTGVPCPTGAGPAGVCTCLNGFTGSVVWQGSGWAGTCTAATCPANTNGISGSCICNTGYAGLAVWSGTAWTHTCDLQACPTNSQAPNCVCDTGYAGTPNWLTGTRWTHTCSLAQCPTGASGTGCPCNAGFVSNPSTPQWDSSRQAWTHTCTSTTGGCTQYPNTVQNGNTCQCTTGFSGNLVCNGFVCTGSCTATSCAAYPNTVQSGNTCQCAAGFSGNFACNTNSFVCTGSCTTTPTSCVTYPNSVQNGNTCQCATGFSGNLVCNGFVCTGSCASSCAQYPNTVQNGNTCQCITGFSGNLACNGFVCTGSCSTSNSCAQYANTVQNGNTCQCVTGFSGNFACNGFVCTGSCASASNRAPCDGVCNFRSCPNGNIITGANRCNNLDVTISAVGAVSSFSQLYITNMHPGTGETTQTITSVVCGTSGANIFSTNPTMTAGGQLNFAINNVGVSDVTCTATDSQGASTSFTFTVTGLLAGGPTPPTPAGNQRWMRMYLKSTTSVALFSKSAFITTVMNILRNVISGLTTISVKWVCQRSRCTNDVCPADTAGRLAIGCAAGDSITTSRLAELMQAVTSDQVIVDFDLETGAAPGSATKTAQQTTATNTLNTDITSCSTTSTCQLKTGTFEPIGVNSVLTDVVTVTTTPSPDSDDDDSWDWWVWLLIGLGAFLLLLCLILLLWCCCRDKKDKEEEQKKEVYEGSQMQTYESNQQSAGRQAGPSQGGPQKDGEYTSYNDYNYTSAGSEEYYSSYEPTSYAEGGEVVEFTPDEVIKAQYIDGEYYEGTIWSKAPDGTYNIRWFDGSHSEGVPPEQILRK